LENRNGGGEMTGVDRKRRPDTGIEEILSPMLTISEACQLLNIHSNTLRRWSAKGLVREYRVGLGGHRRFKVDDIAALILEQPRYRQVKTNKLSRH
jgi:excisionase family DNA binding protein